MRGKRRLVGVYGLRNREMGAFPPELAAEITVKVFSRVGDLSPHLRCVRMCVVNDFLRAVYVAALQSKGLSVSQAASTPA